MDFSWLVIFVNQGGIYLSRGTYNVIFFKLNLQFLNNNKKKNLKTSQ